MIALALVALALAAACAALAVALRRARREAAGLRRSFDDSRTLLHALSDELNRARAAASRNAPTPPPPTPAADFVTVLYNQPLPPLRLKRALAPGEEPAGFAVRWGDA